MRLTSALGLRRIINSAYHPFQTIPKADRWHIRERQNRFTAWQYSSDRSTYKYGNMKLNKLFCYLDMQRRDERKLERHYAEQRLEAALAEHHFEYKHFRNMLDKAHILLDNIVLSQLAIYEPMTFQSLVALAKEMAIKDGRAVIPDDEFRFEVHLDDALFGEPFQRPVQFPRGPSENHTSKPRKLDPSEY
uniref:Ribosomal protein L20 n=1 Tax=Angiostrongylus cantonensis TaxID=6313 RepID=A0A0K0CTL2_ANGCA